jgi:predicted RNase H-like HicB family nuclease
MRPFTYAVKLAPDKQEGGYVVTCRDLPESVTQGETLEEAPGAGWAWFVDRRWIVQGGNV